MEKLPGHTFVFFPPVYLTRMGDAEWADVCEDKEGRVGNRAVEDPGSQVEEFKCADGKKQDMERLPSSFCSWAASSREGSSDFLEIAYL